MQEFIGVLKLRKVLCKMRWAGWMAGVKERKKHQIYTKICS